MALFGLVTMVGGDLEDDLDDNPFFSSEMRSMRHMNDMMSSIFNNPFGMMGQNAITNGGHGGGRHPHSNLQMMPFGFPPMPSFNMNTMFRDFDNVGSGSNCHSFTTRSVMTMGNGPDGRPQVYQETMSTTTAPGGVKETKKTVHDSRTGVKKMAIGHHIGERAHILEHEQNIHSGEQEERQEFINLDEEEAETFNSEWQTRTRNAVGSSSHYGGHGHRSRPDHRQLALPDPSGGSRYSNSSRWTPSSRRSIRPSPTSKSHSSHLASSSDASGRSNKPLAITAKPSSTAAAAAPAASTSTSTSTSAPSTTGNRKREHTPDVKVSKKRHAVSDSNI